VRVTDKMIFEGASRRAGKARDELLAATQEASTGVRVVRPWDDPGAASKVITHRAGADRMAAIAETASRAAGELEAVDGALGGMNDLLNEARALAVQFSNDTYSPNERAAAASEIQGLIAQAVTLGNSRHGGRYLFGGFKDAAPPFATDGAYLGDDGIRRVEVAPGQFEDASVRGDLLFNGANGGVDIFGTLNAFKTALSTNDKAGIENALGGIESSIDQIVQGRAKAGTAVNVFETAIAASEVARDADKAAASKLTDADVFSSASRLAYAQRALDAALTASAKSFEPSLLKKLG
jgi:flagellar hook-associated protein 3 FlgL